MKKFYDPCGEEHTRSDESIEWRISAYGLAQKDDSILLVKPTWVDRWDFPGGGINVDETVKEGLSREFFEETGIKPKSIETAPIHLHEGNFFWQKDQNDKEKKHFCHSLALVYKVQVYEEAFLNFDKKEIREVKWVTINSLEEKNCQSIIWPVIKKLK